MTIECRVKSEIRPIAYLARVSGACMMQRALVPHNPFLSTMHELRTDARYALCSRCVASCGSGTAGAVNEPLKPGMDAEENKWNHYNEFVFARE
jgi:hypothetical protein